MTMTLATFEKYAEMIEKEFTEIKTNQYLL